MDYRYFSKQLGYYTTTKISEFGYSPDDWVGLSDSEKQTIANEYEEGFMPPDFYD